MRLGKAKVAAIQIRGVLNEGKAGARDRRPLLVAGARDLVPLLARELRAGGDTAAVLEGSAPEGAAALIWIGPPDVAVLRAAERARVPVIGITEGESLPYVLDTRIVTLAPGSGFPIDEIARVVAAALGERGAALAARLPVLREQVIDELIRRCARRNAVIAVAVFVPGVDMPVLTLNEARLVLRIALASGRDTEAIPVAELASVVGAGLGLRAIARELLDLVPAAGWAAKGAVAYGGTRAIGEAARRRFESVRSGS